MTYIYQNKILLKVFLICALFCTKCFALPGSDDDTVSNVEASNSPVGRGAMPTDSDPLEVRSIVEDDINAPVDTRKEYVQKNDPERNMYYYEKKPAPGLIQALKELLWNLWFY